MASILIVDDEYVTHRIISVILGNRGYVLRSAYNGIEALELLEMYPVDMILTDISMPYMDGLELIERVRANPAYADIPIVIISASPQPELPILGLEKGATAFISQPFSSWELVNIIASCLDPQVETGQAPLS